MTILKDATNIILTIYVSRYPDNRNPEEWCVSGPMGTPLFIILTPRKYFILRVKASIFKCRDLLTAHSEIAINNAVIYKIKIVNYGKFCKQRCL